MVYSNTENRTQLLNIVQMVRKSIDAKVRPLANTSLEKASLLGAARLYVSKDTLISLTGTLEGGRACWVERLESEEPLKREASLWVLPDKNLSPNVVVMTRAFQEATGLKIGDQVRVSLTGENTVDADEVVVKDISDTVQEDPATYKFPPRWETTLSISLGSSSLFAFASHPRAMLLCPVESL